MSNWKNTDKSELEQLINRANDISRELEQFRILVEKFSNDTNSETGNISDRVIKVFLGIALSLILSKIITSNKNILVNSLTIHICFAIIGGSLGALVIPESMKDKINRLNKEAEFHMQKLQELNNKNPSYIRNEVFQQEYEYRSHLLRNILEELTLLNYKNQSNNFPLSDNFQAYIEPKDFQNSPKNKKLFKPQTKDEEES